jgi:hypothetical protein
MKSGRVFDYLSDYQLLKKDSGQWSESTLVFWWLYNSGSSPLGLTI